MKKYYTDEVRSFILIEKKDIKKILPHRGQMLLVDKAELYCDACCGWHKIKKENKIIKGHFPNVPIFPASLQIEFMSQTAAVMLKDMGGKTPCIISIDYAKFKKPVIPDCILMSKAKLKKRRGNIFKIEVFCSVDNIEVSTAKITAALVDNKKLV